jgi:NADP-dependent 3-hydroxy acid dehydrogenase YdfG
MTDTAKLRRPPSTSAGGVTDIVTRPRHVAVNEMVIRPTEQER